MIDSFFDFTKPSKKYEQPKCFDVVPKERPVKKPQSMEREETGCSYASSYKGEALNDLTKVKKKASF